MEGKQHALRSQRCDTHSRSSQSCQRGWTHPPQCAAACTHPRAGTVLPASVMLHLAPCHGAASSGALPCARECVSPAARTPCAREAPAACGGFGKTQGSLQRATLIGRIAFSCRAQFRSYKVFSPQARVRKMHKQAGRSRTGRQGAWMKAWEHQELSQGVGMRKSGSSLGIDTYKIEREGSSCLIRDGISQGCGEAGHPNAFS